MEQRVGERLRTSNRAALVESPAWSEPFAAASSSPAPSPPTASGAPRRDMGLAVSPADLPGLPEDSGDSLQVAIVTRMEKEGNATP